VRAVVAPARDSTANSTANSTASANANATASAAVQHTAPTPEYYVYDRAGITLGRQVFGQDADFRQIAIRRTAAGLPTRVGGRTLTYSADRRLIEVREGNGNDRGDKAAVDDPLSSRVLGRYTHNAYGERIGKVVDSAADESGRGSGVGGAGSTDSNSYNSKIASSPVGTSYLYWQQRLVAQSVAGQPDRIARRYVYAHGVPVALIDYPRGQPLADVDEQPEALWVRTRALLRAALAWINGSSVQLHFVHANEIGTPTAVTDGNRRVLWRARLSAYGEARIEAAQVKSGSATRATATNAASQPARFALDLRLPGQLFDAETGWHDNYLRTYDPTRGQYLEPDPLGPTAFGAHAWRSRTQPYSYTNHNPLTYADPLGLILFAFDGTENTDDPTYLQSRGSSRSNVVRFRDLYLDGKKRYVTGVGTVHRDEEYGDIIPPLLDRASNRSGYTRIERMLRYFQDEAGDTPDDQVMNVDIVGFSRGSAQARDFANSIARDVRGGWYEYRDAATNALLCQRVNLRFMGLFDTVLSVNGSGHSYTMGIPGAFQHVAHAVALNEYRSDSLLSWTMRNPLPNLDHTGGFPLESIGASSQQPGAVRVEMGFIGAHADIGGGYSDSDNQLSFVALHWMVAQATQAGVQMRPANKRRSAHCQSCSA